MCCVHHQCPNKKNVLNVWAPFCYTSGFYFVTDACAFLLLWYRPISNIRLGLFSRPRSDLILPGVTLVWSYFGSYFGSCVILTSVGSYMQNAPNQSPKVGLVWFCSCYQLPKQHMPTAIQQKGCKGKTPQIATASSSTGRYPSCDCCYDCCLNNGRAHANLLAATQICNNVPNKV